MMKSAICIENLTRDFDSIRALDGLSSEIPPGIIFGFLGPNGAGKTTTIRLLLGLLEPTAGHASVLGFDTQTQAAQVRAHTGALLEHTGIYEQMSAADNLEFYGRAFRLPPARRKARIRELLTHMGLWERRHDRAGKWSRGMKQKLALARTLLHRPRLVLLLVSLAVVNVLQWNESLQIYRPAILAINIAASLLMSGMVASLGILISLRSPTVQGAAQTIMLMLFMPLLLLQAVVFLLPTFLPRDVIRQFLDRVDLTGILLAFLVVLLVATIGLLRAAMLRFRRSQLIL